MEEKRSAAAVRSVADVVGNPDLVSGLGRRCRTCEMVHPCCPYGRRLAFHYPPTQRCAGKPEVNAFLLAPGRRLSVGDSLGPVTHRCILRGASAPHEMHDQGNDGHDE